MDPDLEELHQQSLELLLERKEELKSEGNWSEQDLIDFATVLNSDGFKKTKGYLEKSLRRISVKSIIAKEDALAAQLKKAEFTHYLKFSYELNIDRGMVSIITKYNLFDERGHPIMMDGDKNFFKQIKDINKKAKQLQKDTG